MKQEIAQKIIRATAATYDAIATEFSASRHKPWEELRRVLDFVKPGDRILDAGCGNGRLFELFKGKEIEYVGIDSSSKLIELARRRWPEAQAKFEVGGILNLPFADNSFDLVLSVAVLHHLPSKTQRLQAMKEMARVLKPGGILFMTNWNRLRPEDWGLLVRYSLLKILGLFIPRSLGEVGRGSDLDWGDIFIPWSKSGKYRYYHVFTRRGLAYLFRQAGFEVTENYLTSPVRGRSRSATAASNGMKNGHRKSWWNGANIVTIGTKLEQKARLD